MVARNIVKVSAGLRLGRRLVRGPVCGRGYSKHVSKCPRKGFVGLESGFERGLGNGFAGELQVSRGALQPQASNVLLQRLANESPENAVKMKAGEGRDPRHLVQFQIVIQMLLDVHERSDDALAIVLFGGWLHCRASHSAPTRTA